MNIVAPPELAILLVFSPLWMWCSWMKRREINKKSHRTCYIKLNTKCYVNDVDELLASMWKVEKVEKKKECLSNVSSHNIHSSIKRKFILTLVFSFGSIRSAIKCSRNSSFTWWNVFFIKYTEHSAYTVLT